ncbi:unnamed protein product [Ceratitis capitata]|uniref:(Mediterranean fruit fly) hypothetical protein n=1 Tax=Ceratitis capitata TaxID=7213 RepID=A0A811U4B4_CERCA|nr:unnamed protein product [Ceratitis capitata]
MVEVPLAVIAIQSGEVQLVLWKDQGGENLLLSLKDTNEVLLQQRVLQLKTSFRCGHYFVQEPGIRPANPNDNEEFVINGDW